MRPSYTRSGKIYFQRSIKEPIQRNGFSPLLELENILLLEQATNPKLGSRTIPRQTKWAWEFFAEKKIEKYNRYKDKIIFSLEFNIWKLRRWIEFRSAILIFVLHVEIYTPINILASWRSSLCYCTRTTVIAHLILIRTFWINLLIIF